MKKLLIIGLIAGLGLCSCQKDTTSISETKDQEIFVLNGEKFNINDVHSKLALITGIDKDQFTFAPDSLAFALSNKYNDEYSLLYIKDYIDVIKNLEI